VGRQEIFVQRLCPIPGGRVGTGASTGTIAPALGYPGAILAILGAASGRDIGETIVIAMEWRVARVARQCIAW